MFPIETGSWLIIGVACVIGFFIGHWIQKRREKDQLPPFTLPRQSRKERRKKKK
jgi:hypothetical protein